MVPADLSITHQRAKANRLDFHWVERGEGPLVVLLHGFPENWWSWRYQIAPLADAGLRVIAPDMRGYNETEKKGPYDLDTLALDVAELIKAAGAEKAHVVGHGWGGAVTWRLASTHPEVVDKVAVLNCPHPARMFDALKSSPDAFKKSWYFLIFQLPWLPELLMSSDRAARLIRVYRSHTRNHDHFSAEELQPFVDALERPGAAKAMLGAYRAVFTQALKDGFSLGTVWPTVPAEVLLLFSRNDGELRYQDLVPGIEKLAPKLEAHGFDHCGRFLHAETPQPVNDALLTFLLRGASDVARATTGEVPTAVTVVLESHGENLITVIKEVRTITGLALKEARELVESAPATVKDKVSLREALDIKRILTAAGATVGLR